MIVPSCSYIPSLDLGDQVSFTHEVYKDRFKHGSKIYAVWRRCENYGFITMQDGIIVGLRYKQSGIVERSWGGSGPEDEYCQGYLTTIRTHAVYLVATKLRKKHAMVLASDILYGPKETSE